MDLNGSLALSIQPSEAVEGFHDVETLRQFLPGNSELTKTGPAEFTFVVTKDAGLVSLRLPGTLTIQPESDAWRFEAAARHILGGSANLSLNIRFDPSDTGGTIMIYQGTLTAGGLAGRLLREREGQASNVIGARFQSVRRQLEWTYDKAART